MHQVSPAFSPDQVLRSFRRLSVAVGCVYSLVAPLIIATPQAEVPTQLQRARQNLVLRAHFTREIMRLGIERPQTMAFQNLVDRRIDSFVIDIQDRFGELTQLHRQLSVTRNPAAPEPDKTRTLQSRLKRIRSVADDLTHEIRMVFPDMETRRSRQLAADSETDIATVEEAAIQLGHWIRESRLAFFKYVFGTEVTVNVEKLGHSDVLGILRRISTLSRDLEDRVASLPEGE